MSAHPLARRSDGHCRDPWHVVQKEEEEENGREGNGGVDDCGVAITRVEEEEMEMEGCQGGGGWDRETRSLQRRVLWKRVNELRELYSRTRVLNSQDMVRFSVVEQVELRVFPVRWFSGCISISLEAETAAWSRS